MTPKLNKMNVIKFFASVNEVKGYKNVIFIKFSIFRYIPKLAIRNRTNLIIHKL